MRNPLAPHSDERLRRQLLHRFPRRFNGRKGIAPDRAPAPFFALLPAFAGGTHRFPGDAIGLAEVLRGAFPALMMDQVEIIQVRLPVRHPVEQNAFGNDLVGCRNGIIAGIENVSGAEFAELVFAQLEQPDIRPGALLGVETGLDLGHPFMKLKSRPKASDARLISSIGVPTGMSLNERKTIAAGFSAGGSSDQI